MDLIGVISLIIAISAATFSYFSFNENKRIKRFTQNFSRLINVEEMLSKNPSFLEFHGVSKKLLDENNVTAEEVAYILLSVRAGQEDSRIKNKRKYRLSPYRKKLFSNEKTQLIWKNILKERLIFRSSFVKAVDEYIANK
ncbi:MAG: hypothetical protein DWQ05_08335 [Calditrichaeota bacterium]|nr:MAG: hypothetical protein DWQ05_08335 [Calditrichota bacterium]